MKDAGETLDDMVQMRRRAFDPPIPAERRLWGLALSGGGIRSATFCLGLIKALAANKQLRQFDLMSTVSGGGYAGSSLGKLFHETADGVKLEERLGTMESTWWLNWLRANGRYLAPSGTRDTLIAFANFGRNLLGIHIELAVLALLLACALVGFDLLIWCAADRWAGTAQQVDGGLKWTLLAMVVKLPTVFVLLLPMLFWAAILCFAYWLLPSGPAMRVESRLLAMAALPLASLYGLFWLYTQGSGGGADFWAPLMGGGWLVAAVLILGAWACGSCYALVLAAQIKNQGSADHIRNRLTNRLGRTLFWFLGVVLAGYADLAAWSLAQKATEMPVVFRVSK